MSSWITVHSLFSLSWDEWLSIAMIIGSAATALHWIITRMGKTIFDPIRRQLSQINKHMDEYSDRQLRSEARLERGDKKFIIHDEELKDHERRLGRLEGFEHHEH